LTLFVPLKSFYGVATPPGFAVVFFVTIGYVFSCLLLWRMLREADAQPPLWLAGVAFAGLGLAQFTPIIMRRPDTYEIAIAAGFAFFTAALYFLALRILHKAEHASFLTLLAGVCLGMSPGCRPHLVLAVVALAGFYAV